MGVRFFLRGKLACYVLLGAISISSLGFCDGGETTPKEALTLRRITEYWKDGDYAAVKRQISYFLEKNPNSNLRDHLHAILDDL